MAGFDSSPPVLSFKPPVLEAVDLAHLQSLVRPGSATAMLCAPASVAWWICRTLPHLAHKRKLRLALLGAEYWELFSDWEALPALLGNPGLALEVAAVSPALPGQARFASVHPGAGLPTIATSVFAGSAQEFFACHPASQWDLVVAFHPGLESHSQSWMVGMGGKSAFDDVLAANVPVLLSSYAQDEMAFDQAFVGLYGYECAQSAQNPFSCEGPGPVELAVLCDYLWSMRAAPVSERNQPKLVSECVRRLEYLSSLFAHYASISMTFGWPLEEVAAIGSPVQLSDHKGRVRWFVRLYRGLVASMDGDIYLRLESNLGAAAHLSVPDRLMTNLPTASTPWVDRALWVSYVWESTVEPNLSSSPVLLLHTLAGGRSSLSTDELIDLADGAVALSAVSTDDLRLVDQGRFG